MSIVFHEKNRTFHLFNDKISYIMAVLPNGQMGQLYFGKRIHQREDYSYLLEMMARPMGSYVFENDRTLSLEHVKQEYGVYGSTDYRCPAVEILQENGSRISDFCYKSHTVSGGKPKLKGLPATYTESDSEAETLTLVLEDKVTGIELELLYTLFAGSGIIARSARFLNCGKKPVHLLKAMSLCMDLPDHDYDWIQFSGAWARERYPKKRRLETGIQSVGSMRGHSSHEHNPFVILKRPTADEFQGEVIGFSLIYSGNFLAQAEVDTHDTTRVLLGINPEWFDWKLEPGEEFQTPEAVMVYTDRGMNDMSQTFHRLFQKRLARGYWRDRERPILINNWEATYFDFTEERIVEIAKKAKEQGYSVTMFGRRRPVPELKSSNFMQRSFGERVAMNAPIQGTAADIIKIAMIRVNERLKREQLRARLLLQVHDELLIEAPLEEVDQVQRILEEEMTHAADLKVKLEIDMHTGNSWYEAK